MADRNTHPLSTADAAYVRFDEFLKDRTLAGWDADLNEADTRAKLIDPLFKVILEWQEVEIRREEPAADGFADYLFGADFPYFHIEAKRLKPRFRLQVPSRSRILQLSGPHLLGEKAMKPLLEQAAKYAFDLGTDFTILTNGEQFILFRTRLPGQTWRGGQALVWHDYADIRDDFANFHSLLSRERVRAGSLVQSFAFADSVTVNRYSPLEYVHNADAELVRNRFWSSLSRIVGPLLSPPPDAVELQDEIIRHCYVRTPLSDEADASINALLADAPPRFLKHAQAVDIRRDKKNAFDHAIEADIKGSKPGTYILTGGVGSGKTTFLRRFANVVQASFVREWCIWAHVDFLSMGNVTPDSLDQELQLFTFKRIREIVTTEYADFCPKSGEAVRELFADEIKAAELTLLYGVSSGSEEWTRRVNDIVHRYYTDDRAYVEAILKAARKRGRRVVIVLDNTDQLGEAFQEAVFLLSQRLATDCNGLAIVSLREEKFFAAYRRGIFDAYGDRRFHIGSPHLEKVIRARLEYALRRYKEESKTDSVFPQPAEEQAQLELVLRVFIDSTTKGNRNIVRLLACASNGDMRYALAMFREFISSGNTDIEKILQIIKRRRRYTVPFHEFAKGAILGSRRYYRSSLSQIANLFVPSAARGASHFAGLRFLARLSSSEGAPSPHGQGFVDTSQILSEYRRSFGTADDLILRGEELLRRGLLESEPPKAASLERTDAVRICASGAYYWRYLVRSFAYVDLVLLDTPITSQQLAQRLADLAGYTDLTVRFERVRMFLDYLLQQESKELLGCLQVDGPYSQPLMPAVMRQIEHEIKFIRKRTGALDLAVQG